MSRDRRPAVLGFAVVRDVHRVDESGGHLDELDLRLAREDATRLDRGGRVLRHGAGARARILGEPDTGEHEAPGEREQSGPATTSAARTVRHG